VTDAHDRILENIRWQAVLCGQLGSPLAEAVLESVAENYASGGGARDILAAWPGDPFADNLTTRLLGGLHRLALDGQAPALAALYPSCGGQWSGEFLEDPVRTTLRDNTGFLSSYITLPPQTNEVRRSAALHGGFLAAAAQTGLPLALREIGASAGLNLMWDQFRYANAAYSWKVTGSDVWIETEWSGGLPDVDAPVQIADRAGCDISPLDVINLEDRRRLESYVWPDQAERLERLRSAIGIAKKLRPRLDTADAEDWLRGELGRRTAGLCTVIFHSIFWQYIPKDKQAALRQLIEDAGSASDGRTPLAWLRLEPDEVTDFPDIRLTIWPGGEERVLGTAHFHGAWVKWAA
jgi:hypothetical protein